MLYHDEPWNVASIYTPERPSSKSAKAMVSIKTKLWVNLRSEQNFSAALTAVLLPFQILFTQRNENRAWSQVYANLYYIFQPNLP